MKKKIGRMIPYPLIQAGRRIIHAGVRQCPVCLGKIRRYTDSGYGFEALERYQVVGGLKRPADRCPLCHSTSRERLVWFWLSQKGTQFRFDRPCTIAHFAPEKGLTTRLRAASPEGYNAYDLEPGRYRHLADVRQADLTKLPMADATVSLLICNHVIEHVPDVAASLAQIYRVLQPGGVAILQVPIALKLENSIELGLESTPADRIQQVGQDDHLRLFNTADYVAVLEKAGFAVESYDAFDDDAKAATTWQLDPFEVLFICRKSAG